MPASSVVSPRGRRLELSWLGRVPYGRALALQEELRDARLLGTGADNILLLEHPDVITFGRGAREDSCAFTDDELRARGYEVFRTNRGGDVTWHGPGQLVGYPILDLSVRGRDVHVYLRRLEHVLIDVLAAFGVSAVARPGYAGVWLDATRKIASIGVGLRRWVTLHGFALNVSCDLDRFAAIVPCGLEGVEMVSLESVLGRPVDAADVRARVAQELEKAFA